MITIFENGFEASVRLKTNVTSVWKWYFLNDKVETIFWGSEEKIIKLFKAKNCHKDRCRKWFWKYLVFKTKVLSVWKFFTFLQIFEWRKWNHWEIERRNWKQSNDFKSVYTKNWNTRQGLSFFWYEKFVKWSFLDNDFEPTSAKTNVLNVGKFPFLRVCKLWKRGKALKTLYIKPHLLGGFTWFC